MGKVTLDSIGQIFSWYKTKHCGFPPVWGQA